MSEVKPDIKTATFSELYVSEDWVDKQKEYNVRLNSESLAISISRAKTALVALATVHDTIMDLAKSLNSIILEAERIKK